MADHAQEDPRLSESERKGVEEKFRKELLRYAHTRGKEWEEDGCFSLLLCRVKLAR